MAEFTEVMEHRQRMCDEMESCLVCPLNGNAISGCFTFIKKRPQEAEEIIMKWADENPIQTNADKFKEVMEKTFGVPAHIGSPNCSLIDCPDNVACGDCEYNGFWQKEYREPKGEK